MQAEKYDVIVSEIIEINENTKLFRLWFPEIKKFNFKPGQFLMVWDEKFNEHKGNKIRRAYSISSNPEEKNYLELCIKKTGSNGLSDKFMSYKKGQKLKIEGPFGNFVIKKDTKNALFFAGGTGIAPLMSMIKHLDSIKFSGNVDLFFSFKKPEDFLYKDYITSLQLKNKKFEPFLFVTDPIVKDWEGDIGRINIESIKKYTKNLDYDVYICGPFAFVSAIVKDLQSVGISKDKIHKEAWQ